MIRDIMTTKEASELWRVSQVAVKKACTGQKGYPPKLQEGIECKKSGGTWLITRQGMERLYGRAKEMKTYKITMGCETPIELTTNAASDLLFGLLEMASRCESRGGVVPLGFADDASELDLEDAFGNGPVMFSDAGDVVAIDLEGTANELYAKFKTMNAYDLDCEVI